MDRSKIIIRTSIIGIGVNLILVIFKAMAGFLTGSIAIILDAVNNLSDALSSAITIIGTKLAGKAPDKKHPYGYGRIEYMTSVLIATIILIAGITSFKESIQKIIAPTTAEYTPVSLIIITAAVIAKFAIGQYVKKVGREINSGSLIASGSDALFDSVISLGTLAAAVISMTWNLSLEGIFGGIISIFIIRAGIEMLTETLDSIIGIRAEKDLTEKVKETLHTYPCVAGAYDLTLHNYGPAQIIGSVHIEVPDDMTAKEIHKITRKMTVDIYESFGIILTVGIYASNTSSPKSEEIKKAVSDSIRHYPDILEMHGFYLDEEKKTVMFDLIIDFKADAPAIKKQLLSEIQKNYPEYQFFIILDSDYSG